jgi:pimeloyl-ACP methyl ester carboxylesterase
MSYTHVTAPTQFVETNGIRFAYRRFGKEGGVPVVLMPHFRAGMDHWDPAVTDGFAARRQVILFDNAGVASSSGETPSTFEAMGNYAADFIEALGLSQVDILGFSIGGFIAQTMALRHSKIIRRLLLVGTGPRNGEPSTDAKYPPLAASTDPATGEGGLDAFLYLFFSSSPRGQAAGRAFWERRHNRKIDVDVPSSPQTMAAQQAARREWQEPRGERFAELKLIAQPTLVVNGSNDIMIPTINSFTLAQNIPDAQLIIYPDSGHASLFQYPQLFLLHANIFLNE